MHINIYVRTYNLFKLLSFSYVNHPYIFDLAIIYILDWFYIVYYF